MLYNYAEVKCVQYLCSHEDVVMNIKELKEAVYTHAHIVNTFKRHIYSQSARKFVSNTLCYIYIQVA